MNPYRIHTHPLLCYSVIPAYAGGVRYSDDFHNDDGKVCKY